MVDELGGLETALDLAGQLAELAPDAPLKLVEYPKPRKLPFPPRRENSEPVSAWLQSVADLVAGSMPKIETARMSSARHGASGRTEPRPPAEGEVGRTAALPGTLYRMLGTGPRRTPVLPMMVVAPAALFVFDAIRVTVTLASRSPALRGLVAVIILGVGALTLPVVERASRTTVLTLIGLLGLARVVMQLLAPTPSLWGQATAAAAVVGLFGALVASFAIVHGGRVVGLGLVVGAAADVAVQSALATVPIPWWRGRLPGLAITAVAVAMVVGMAADRQFTMPRRPPARVPAVAVVTVGAWVALHVMVVGNLGWLGLTIDGELWLVAGAPAVGLVGALVWELQGRQASQPAAAAFIVIVAAALLLAADGIWAAAVAAAVAASAAVALTGSLERDSSAAPERVVWAAGAAPALALLPVAAREIEVSWAPDPRLVVLAVALVVVGGAVLSLQHNPGPSPRAPWAAVAGLAAALVAVGSVIVAAAPSLTDPPSGELVVATLNLEGGFTPEGRYDPEAAARLIVDLGADVVALQEVTRGRMRDGAGDLAVYLERRTGLEVEWTGGSDGEGAAVAFRVTPAALTDRSVPGVVHVLEMSVGPHGEELRVLAVDAVAAPAPASGADVGAALLQVWGQQGRTTLIGSLDGPPATEPVASLLNGGLFDVTLALAGINPLTWPAELPTAQLDYILISADLRPAGARVAETSSSNHLPVVARVAVREE